MESVVWAGKLPETATGPTYFAKIRQLMPMGGVYVPGHPEESYVTDWQWDYVTEERPVSEILVF